MKKRKVLKIFLRVVIVCVLLVIVFFVGTNIYHNIKTKQEIKLLKEEGYYNPVSVGEYCLNVAMFGNEDGEHTIVGMAGLGSGDFSVAARKMTASLEEENLVVFVDRAGYGFSDDTENEMTLEYIVEDYRKALKNAGIKSPYILMPHSVGGAYANYWVSNYPEEIEAIVFVDGSQLSENAFEECPAYEIGIGERFTAFLAKHGFSRYVLRDYFYHYPDNYTDEEQRHADALMYMTFDSIAPISEDAKIAKNSQEAFKGIVTNDVPKLYICASWGIQDEDDLIETNKWTNRQIEINNMDVELRPLEYEEEKLDEILTLYEETRKDIIYPYAEKMGNCEVVCLAGDHMIYEQKPEECSEIIKSFIDGLNK